MKAHKRGGPTKWRHADYVRFAKYIDANPGKTLVECRRDLKCGQPALQIAYVMTRRRKTRLFGA